MSTDRDLADRAAAAYSVGAISHPGLAGRAATYDEGGLLGRATGSPAPYFSWLYVVDDAADLRALRQAVDWFDERDQPFSVRLREHQLPGFDELLRDLGFRPELVMPGMVASPVPRPIAGVDGLVVERVADRVTYDEFTATVAPGGPGAWLTTQLYRDFMPVELLEDPSVAYFLGRLEGAVVASTGARLDDGVVTVFAVGTAERARRRGIGTAMTAGALEWGRDHGADLAFLTSSDMARSMYESMGFRAVDTWTFYLRSWP